MERDYTMERVTNILAISTHTLTWSVTLGISVTGNRLNISTHTLTWSVTLDEGAKGIVFANFNSHAHVERDQVF